MNLVDVRNNPDAAGILFELLLERPQYAWISHAVMPSRSEHEAFVESHPFRYWYLIQTGGAYVGAIECTSNNEIGVHVLRRHQRCGYGGAALHKFIKTHQPLPPIKAVRNGRWLANIASGNLGAKAFFERRGFSQIQETFAL